MTEQRSRLMLGLAIAGLLALLAVFAVELVDSQSKARRDVEGRFSDRANAAGALTGSLFSASSDSAQEENQRRFGGAEISERALAKQAKESQARYLMVLDKNGHVIAASSGTTAAERRVVASKPAYIRDLLGGRSYAISNMHRTSDGAGFDYGQSF